MIILKEYGRQEKWMKNHSCANNKSSLHYYLNFHKLIDTNNQLLSHFLSLPVGFSQLIINYK